MASRPQTGHSASGVREESQNQRCVEKGCRYRESPSPDYTEEFGFQDCSPRMPSRSGMSARGSMPFNGGAAHLMQIAQTKHMMSEAALGSNRRPVCSERQGAFARAGQSISRPGSNSRQVPTPNRMRMTHDYTKERGVSPSTDVFY